MASAANQLSNALNELAMYEELHEAGFPFSRLPVELQIKIVNILSQYPEFESATSRLQTFIRSCYNMPVFQS